MASADRLLLVELCVILAAPPLLAHGANRQLHFPALFVLAGYCLWRLSRAGALRTYVRFDWPACSTALPGILLRSCIAWLAILGLVLWLYPGRLLCLPLNSTLIMAGVAIGYTFISVLPQEFVFRCYAGWRLDSMRVSFLPTMLISAILFGWVHILFGAWLSVGLSFAAGLAFYRTYRNSRSIAAVWVEHSLYGLGVIVLGLDPLFYQGDFFETFVPACAGNG
ncbi:MAG: CPBP family intramembrane metalloprotease [Hyphomicrobiales bacterium]|nr:CPBP family intramembrane metalloprotease [Hyphomicrobiales bacterium]MCP5000897.1 CPBP family intramembrane metalloprotease [Hyphomicrobiales bacterium]